MTERLALCTCTPILRFVATANNAITTARQSWFPNNCGYEQYVSATQVEASLEALDDVGNVIVTRTTHTDGYSWMVTFSSCRANDTTGADTCNTGDVELITFAANGSLAGCSSGGPSASSMVVVNGSAGESVDVTDLSDGPPYR